MTNLFIPGPVDVAEEVLFAQTKAMLPHRSQEFEVLFRSSLEKLRQLFYTKEHIYISASSGSGWQEAAVRNLAKKDILSCVNGAFSKRWHQVAVSNGKSADLLELPWNQPFTSKIVSEALQKKPYELITIVHNETSTGMENPVKEIAETVHHISPNTLISVDAVSSLGGTKIETDLWGLDFVLTSSQKCLALPPGLSFAVVSDRALQYAQTVPDRGWYFDLIRLEQHIQKDSTPYTPAISLIYALDVQLDRIFNEGLDNRFTRHEEMAKRVLAWASKNNFRIYAPEGYRSKTVTTIDHQSKLDIPQVNQELIKRGMRIASGYGPLKKETFRIAHMGDTTLKDIEQLLLALDDIMTTG